MIVTKKDDTFLLFEQNEHGKISGVFAKYWQEQLFSGHQMREEVEYAIAHHDCAWINLDRKPIWNETHQMPYSFMDYPMYEKIAAYEAGVDEVEKESPYAALLCSMHYTAFINKDSTDLIISRYISREIDRQERLKKRFKDVVSQEQLKCHFDLLRFCDNLSLYICLNEPGTPKSKENKMFINGFPQIFQGINEKIHANWPKEDFVIVKPFPFEQSFKIEIPYKQLHKDDIKENGLQHAYDNAIVHYRTLLIDSEIQQ